VLAQDRPATSHKKQKKSQSVALFKEAVEVLQLIPPIRTMIEGIQNAHDSAQCLGALITWQVVCEIAQVDRCTRAPGFA